MTDAAKSDGQVLLAESVKIGVYFDAKEDAEKVAAAVVANAAPRIRAETVEDVISELRRQKQWFDECTIRALAAATPGFVCVNKAAISELQEAAKVMRALQRGDGPYDYQAQADAEAAFDAALAKMEE